MLAALALSSAKKVSLVTEGKKQIQHKKVAKLDVHDLIIIMQFADKRNAKGYRKVNPASTYKGMFLQEHKSYR